MALVMALVMARGSISVTGNLACHHWRQSQRLHPLFGSGENEVACTEYFWDQLGSAVLVRVTNAATLADLGVSIHQRWEPYPVIKTF